MMTFRFTAKEAAKLAKNWVLRESPDGERAFSEARPVAKLFTPDGAATWLVVAMTQDGRRAYGVADLGLGFVEAGELDLDEIRAVRGHLGLPVERDRWFRADKSAQDYLSEGHLAGFLRA